MRLVLIFQLLLVTISLTANAVPVANKNASITPLMEHGLEKYLPADSEAYNDRSTFLQVVEFVANGQLDRANEKLAQLRVKYANTVGVLELEGLVKIVEGNPAGAEQSLRKALTLDRGIPSIWSKLGSSLVAQGRIQEARSALDTAVKLDSRNSFARHILARLAVADKNYSEAESHYRLGLPEQAEYTVMHRELAELLLLTDQAAAATAFLTPLTNNATDPQPLLLLASAQARSADRDSALNTAAEASKRYPQEIASWTGGASLMLELHANTQAEDLLKRGLQRFPDNLILQIQLANTYQLSGQIEAAEKQYRTLMSDSRARVLALNNLATMLAEQPGRELEGVELARQAYKESPDVVTVQDTLGWALFRAGQANEALGYLRNALKGESVNEEIQCHLAIVTAEVEGTASAREQLQRCANAAVNDAVSSLATTYLSRNY